MASLAYILLVISFPINALEKWINCIGNQVCYPYWYYEPHTLKELCETVRYNALSGHKMRAIGNGFSISDIGCTDGCLFNLKHLNHILSINNEKKTVRVEAGITIRELNEKLAKYNLALSNQAAITEISLGGALSTGVHGTGHTGSLSSFIKEFELITAEGSHHTISLESDSETFAAVSVGLGSLGIIYAVTIQCEPLFYLRKIEEVTTIENIITNYQRIFDSNDFFQFFWNPQTGKVIINRWNRCNQTSISKNALIDVGTVAYESLAWYTIDESDKDLFSEIAVPATDLPEVIKAVQGFVKKYNDSGAKIIDVNIRFVEQDKHAYLSPSAECQVAYLTFCLLEEDKYLPIYQEFEEMMIEHKGRPHWGKLNFLNKDKVARLYGNNLQKFIQIKQRLDPQRIFSNNFTDRIL